MHTINVTATRDGKWWVAEFVINGHEYGTQAKHLSQIPAQVADAASLMTGQNAEAFTVMLTTKDSTWVELIDESQLANGELQNAQSALSAASRQL